MHWQLGVAIGAIIYLLVVNLIAIRKMETDKAAAEYGRFLPKGFRRSRIPERTLILWALIGGWPGMWLAMRSFRHKTRKRNFKAKFWWAVAGNLFLIILVYALVSMLKA